eukprot:165487-Pyramimonas_sp.AAC.1
MPQVWAAGHKHATCGHEHAIRAVADQNHAISGPLDLLYALKSLYNPTDSGFLVLSGPGSPRYHPHSTRGFDKKV